MRVCVVVVRTVSSLIRLNPAKFAMDCWYMYRYLMILFRCWIIKFEELVAAVVAAVSLLKQAEGENTSKEGSRLSGFLYSYNYF